MKIFISYRRADSTYLVGRIKDRLVTAFGDQSVFRDLDDIPSGVDFRTVLEEETNGCDVMLVIIGPQWAGITDANGNKRLFDPGDYTRIEVETGLKRLSESKATVIPVLVMNASMPSQQELPESISQLTFQNAINIRNDPDFKSDIEKLIRDIRRSRGYREDDISIEYFEPKTIYIAEGLFLMGSQPRERIPEHETPPKGIFLPAYRIGKYPVTNKQFEEYISQTKTLVSPVLGWDGQKVPQGFEDHPVAGVTWYEALAYCEWLTMRTGRKYSLPNEAEWEKACRGGNKFLYPWGDEFDPKRCNHGQQNIAPVNKYPPQNEFGCHDFVGNVLQWTCTLWGKKRYPPDSQFSKLPWEDDGRNDINANREIRRVVRGSSTNQDVVSHRCSTRSGQAPEERGVPGARFGFRVVMKV